VSSAQAVPLGLVVAGFGLWWFHFWFWHLRKSAGCSYLWLCQRAWQMTLLHVVVFGAAAIFASRPSPQGAGNILFACLGLLSGLGSFFAIGRRRWEHWGFD
jgi:hypothetical protein